MENGITDLVATYYSSWSKGAAHLDLTKLRSVLDPDLDFQGPIDTTKTAATFEKGLVEFANILKEHRFVHRIHQGNEAFVLYDCETHAPTGTLRFAEYFRAEGGKIKEIRLVFDTVKLRPLLEQARRGA